LVQTDRKQSAAESQRQLARRLFANVKVLVEPAARWAEDAPFAPAKFYHFLAVAGRVGSGAALFGPKQSVSRRFENDDHTPTTVVVGFMIKPGGPIGDMTDESVLRGLELNHTHFGSLHVKIVLDFDFFGIGNEVGFPNRLQADGIKICAGSEEIVFAVKTI